LAKGRPSEHTHATFDEELLHALEEDRVQIDFPPLFNLVLLVARLSVTPGKRPLSFIAADADIL
jgi:hypothetical protein